MLRREVSMSRNCTARKGASQLVPAIVIAGMFTAVVVTALFLIRRPGASDEKPARKPEQPARSALQADRGNVPEASSPAVSERARIKAAASQNAHAATTNGGPVTDPAQERLVRLNGHLATGEFGPALELASGVTDPAEKSKLLKLVADAQVEAGEIEAAARTLQRIPLAEERRNASIEQAHHWASAAGGNGADFETLKNLIKKETSGPWFDEEGVGGTLTEEYSGVDVDPNGLLSWLTREDLNGRLKALGLQARKAELNEDMARPGRLRLVSLTRLEREARKRLAEGKPVVETMKNFAGLYRVEYVFVYPESGEIVLGGPAEGWRYGRNGQPVSLSDGKPTLQLDDFVTVYRTFSDGDRSFNCLIVPRKEGLKKARAIAEASRRRGPLSGDASRRNYVRQLTQALGMQDVLVNGVPRNSRVARVIVEADYRMKLIGIDKLDAGRNIPSYFDLLARHPQPTAPQLNALRWWLTMKYDAVNHSEDRNVFHIQGASVRCRGVNEDIRPDGRRVQTGKADPVNALFAENFTNHYAELARRDSVFADLQNIFDLSLVAALLRHEKLNQKAAWDGGSFASGGSYRPRRYEPARTVMSVSNSRVYRGGEVVIQVAGGVRANLMSVVRNERIVRVMPRLGPFRDVAKAPPLPEGRWWWDAKIEK